MSVALQGTVTMLEVASVGRSIAFYRDVLGLELQQSAGEGDYVGWAWLRRDTIELMLNALYDRDEAPGVPDPARVAAHRDTTIFIGCPDVDAAYQHLQAIGLTLDPPTTTHYGMKQLWFTDPDGYGICLQWSTA
jgi:glyoxylase I family protein